MDKAQQDAMKKEAGIEAAKLVKSGMIVGLGTGSTVRFLVDELGRRKQEEGLEFTGVTTSRRTQEQAEGYGIKIVNIDDVDHIDLCIDGADEVDKNFNGIKGGGAALLWEKIVAINSDHIVWIVDASKLVDVIGKFPLPVEVIPFGAMHVIERMKEREDGLIEINAVIYCEKKSHKGIIIGKNGAMLKKIGAEARKDIEELLETKVFLELWVKVKEGWRNNQYQMRNFGYEDE